MRYFDRFKVPEGAILSLADHDPDDTLDLGKSRSKKLLAEEQERLAALQYRLYAEGKRALLACLQGADASGKDGTIRHIFSGINPQGCRVQSFKEPTGHELDHDFLWRVHMWAPERGQITVFNRSHYEDVLIVRVRGLVPEEVWRGRYSLINGFERLLADRGTKTLKFFLHISKEEQLRRFERRLKDPSRHWKISEADYAEREYWDDYITAFEDALSRCSTDKAPWFVIPANNKWARNVIIARILREAMEDMDPQMPEPTVDLKEIRKRYHKARRAERKEQSQSSSD